MAAQTSWINENLTQYLLGRLMQPGVAKLPMVHAMVSRIEQMIKTPALRQDLEQRWQNTLDLQQEHLPFVYAQPAQPAEDMVGSPKAQHRRPLKTVSTLPKTAAGNLTTDTAKPLLAEPDSAATSTPKPETTSRSQTQIKNRSRQVKQRASSVAEHTTGSQTQTKHEKQTKQEALASLAIPHSGVNINRETAPAGGSDQAKTPLLVVPAKQASVSTQPMGPFKSASAQPAQPNVESGAPDGKASPSLGTAIKSLPSIRPTKRKAGNSTNEKTDHKPKKRSALQASGTVSTGNSLSTRPSPLPITRANPVLSKSPVPATALSGATNQPTAMPMVQAATSKQKNLRRDLPLPSSSGPPVTAPSSQPQGLLASRPRPMTPARPAVQSGGIIQRATDPAAEISNEPVETGGATPDIEEIADVVLNKIENKIELEMERRGM